jgi:hypothetical protein
MISVTEGKSFGLDLGIGRYTWTPCMHPCKEWTEMKASPGYLWSSRYLINEEHTGCTGEGRSYHSNKE